VWHTLSSFRTPENMVKTYQTFQLLYSAVNHSYCIALPLHKLANVGFTTTTVFGTIRFFGRMNPIAYCLFPCMSVSTMVFSNIAYKYWGGIVDKTDKIKMTWSLPPASCSSWLGSGAAPTRRDISRTLRPLRDLRINIAGFYHFKKLTVLVYISVVNDYTISLLLLG